MNYKIGDILKVNKASRRKCVTFSASPNATYIQITGVYDTDYYYDIFDYRKERLGDCRICLSDEHLEPLESIENLTEEVVEELTVEEVCKELGRTVKIKK